jgi:hypothetical protein
MEIAGLALCVKHAEKILEEPVVSSRDGLPGPELKVMPRFGSFLC